MKEQKFKKQTFSSEMTRQLYMKAEKVPSETYSCLHRQFLTPLPLFCDNVERDFGKIPELFYLWGDNRVELKTRKGCALVNLDGKNEADDLSIGPLDHHNRKHAKGLVSKCYIESDFTSHTEQMKYMSVLKQFDLCRSSILWWQKGDNFTPHIDVLLPAPNLRLWGCTNAAHMQLRYGEDMIESEFESNRLYLIDTSIIHDATALGEVYQFFIGLLPTEKNYNVLQDLILEHIAN